LDHETTQTSDRKWLGLGKSFEFHLSELSYFTMEVLAFGCIGVVATFSINTFELETKLKAVVGFSQELNVFDAKVAVLVGDSHSADVFYQAFA
jgi:hypothetical protein